jgi:hypothetical protein
MNNPEQRSLFEARAQRDVGIARVTDTNSKWMDSALSMLPAMRRTHDDVTGEDIRVWLIANGLTPPTKPNAWGALTRMAMKRGIICDTGRVRHMRETASHARRTPIWRLAR